MKAAPVKISDEIVEGGCINIYPIGNVFSLLLNKNVTFSTCFLCENDRMVIIDFLHDFFDMGTSIIKRLLYQTEGFRLRSSMELGLKRKILCDDKKVFVTIKPLNKCIRGMLSEMASANLIEYTLYINDHWIINRYVN